MFTCLGPVIEISAPAMRVHGRGKTNIVDTILYTMITLLQKKTFFLSCNFILAIEEYWVYYICILKM